MPRCVFKLLWDTIQSGKEIFAYVLNRAKNGDHYWVFAHVTPSYNEAGTLDGYHYNRRLPDPKIVQEKIAPIYKALLGEGSRHANSKQGMAAGHDMLVKTLQAQGVGYDEFIFSL